MYDCWVGIIWVLSIHINVTSFIACYFLTQRYQNNCKKLSYTGILTLWIWKFSKYDYYYGGRGRQMRGRGGDGLKKLVAVTVHHGW